MSEAGRKIIDGLKDALAGNFSAVTIEGQRWVRSDELDRLTAENERLKEALRKIAYDDYTKADEDIRSSEPTMIWQGVARSALSHGRGGHE